MGASGATGVSAGKRDIRVVERGEEQTTTLGTPGIEDLHWEDESPEHLCLKTRGA